MRPLRLVCVLTLAFLAAGCFKTDVKVDTGSLPGLGRDDDDEEGKAPTQLPSLGGAGRWQDYVAIGTEYVLGGEHGVLFYAFDTLAYPNKPVQLTVRLQTTMLKAIEGASIGFYQGSAILDAANTDADGYAVVEWTPPKPGNYEFTAKITALPPGADEEILKVSPAPLLVAARDPGAEFVVIDLDYTVVGSSFWRVLTIGAKPMAGSVHGALRVSGRYHVIYLTHRPDLLTRKSKVWLKNNGYPRGPLLVSELKDAVGDSGKFKTAKLTDLRKSFPNVRVGIGDKYSDAQAYVDNDLTAYLLPHYKDKPKDMRKAAREVERLRGRGRLQVVSSWSEIEAGIFNGRKFPPETFAAALRRRAGQMEADKRDDDDDDD